MTYIPVEEHAEEYKQTGRWLMDRAEWEFGQGDLIQASEKAWGAAAQFLKALATQRGWAHESHQHLGQVADKLADETGNEDIGNLFDRAESLHANFYEAHRSESSVRRGIDAMQEYLDILEAIPSPGTPPRISHTRERPFHRTRVEQRSQTLSGESDDRPATQTAAQFPGTRYRAVLGGYQAARTHVPDL